VRCGPGRIDAPDARMRERTAQHACIEQPRQADIVGIPGTPGDFLLALDPWVGMADDRERGARVPTGQPNRFDYCIFIFGAFAAAQLVNM